MKKPSLSVFQKALYAIAVAGEIGKEQIRLIRLGFDNDTVLKSTQRLFPGRATIKTVRWYRHKINVVKRYIGEDPLYQR